MGDSTAQHPGLCLNRTNRKGNRVRLRTSSRTIGEDDSKPNPNPNPNANPNPNTKSNLEKRNLGKKLRKRGKKENLPDSNSKTPKLTVLRTMTQPTVPDGNSLQMT